MKNTYKVSTAIVYSLKGPEFRVHPLEDPWFLEGYSVILEDLICNKRDSIE